MLMKKRKAEEDLVLGDYVTVHVSDITEKKIRTGSGTVHDIMEPRDILEQYEPFFQRIQKERAELNVVRNRAA